MKSLSYVPEEVELQTEEVVKSCKLSGLSSCCFCASSASACKRIIIIINDHTNLQTPASGPVHQVSLSYHYFQP